MALLWLLILAFVATGWAQQKPAKPVAKPVAQRVGDVQKDSIDAADDSLSAQFDTATAKENALVADTNDGESFHQSLKTKFIEGNAGFMSLVALALKRLINDCRCWILACCLENAACWFAKRCARSFR